MSSPLFDSPCARCKGRLSVGDLLDNCSHSVPRSGEVWYTCPTCGDDLPVGLENDALLLRSGTEPFPLPGLHVYVDDTYGIDCVYGGRLYHMPRRSAAS